MKCPVCGQDCIQSSDDLLISSHHRFTSCPSCNGLPRDKYLPPCVDTPPPRCPACGKRHLDDVFAHIWLILTEEGVLPVTAPLKDVGIPHLHPSMVLNSPPFLPPASLILLTHAIGIPVAERLMEEVPELRGVVRDRRVVPGISDGYQFPKFHTHELIAGCDLHATIFPSRAGAVVVYQRSSTMHVELPRPTQPKFVSVIGMLNRRHPKLVVDGCCGVGTLGLAAALSGTPSHVILNDRWYAAAFWTGVNIEVNRRPLGIEEFAWCMDFADLCSRKIRTCPVPVAEAAGAGLRLDVWHGDFRCLPRKRTDLGDSLCIFDPFEKSDRYLTEKIMRRWKQDCGGQIFMP